MTPGSGEAAINFIFSVSLTVFIYSVRRETGRDQGVKVPDH